MNLVSEAQGFNLVSRCMDQPPDYPDPNVPTAYVVIFWRARNPTDPAPAWLTGPTVTPQQSVELHYNPAVDKNVEIAPMPYSERGVPGYSSIDYCFMDVGETLIHQRETDAPVIGQDSPATEDTVEIGITGFTRFARMRRVTISANADMSSPLAILLFNSDDYVERELPRYFTLQRNISTDITIESGSPLTTEDNQHLQVEVLPATVYLTVAHSGGTVWTPESNVLGVTFASESGTGGSDGDFDPTPRDEYTINM